MGKKSKLSKPNALSKIHKVRNAGIKKKNNQQKHAYNRMLTFAANMQAEADLKQINMEVNRRGFIRPRVRRRVQKNNGVNSLCKKFKVMGKPNVNVQNIFAGLTLNPKK